MICVRIDVAKDKHDCFINSLLFGDMYILDGEMESRGGNGSLLLQARMLLCFPRPE